MAATDNFPSGVSSDNVAVENPAVDAFTITPSDTAELTKVTRGVYVGNDGDVAVIMREGSSVTFANVIGGTILPIRVRAVKATGTTATNLLGLV